MQLERLHIPGILGYQQATSRSHVLPLVLLIIRLFFCASLSAQSDGLTEDQIKAGFLFNFTKFVEWPPDAFPNANAPIVIAVVGMSPFGDTLSVTAAGKTVGGRAVVVKQFKEGQDLRACTILFISSSEKRQSAHILESLKGSSVLTISEIPGFARSGGIIAFLVEENKVRLEINLDAASEARLKMSAKLIGVARLVPREATRKS